VRSDDLINRILGITQYLGLASWLIGIITVLGSSYRDEHNDCFGNGTHKRNRVRKALGAKKNVAIQFFHRNITYWPTRGMVGIVLGILIGYGIATAFSFDFVIGLPFCRFSDQFYCCGR
jgi:putative ABC transport system permease protein